MQHSSGKHFEFRCTRSRVYQYSVPLDVRQGHYIQADDAAEAHSIMAQQFPADVEGANGPIGAFTVQLWKTWDKDPSPDLLTALDSLSRTGRTELPDID